MRQQIGSYTFDIDVEKTIELYKLSKEEPCDCPQCQNFFVNFKKNESAMQFFKKLGIDIEKGEEMWCYDPDTDFAHYSGYYPFVGTFVERESDHPFEMENTPPRLGDWQTFDFGFKLDFETLNTGEPIIGFDVAFEYKVEEAR